VAGLDVLWSRVPIRAFHLCCSRVKVN
jgi:hypothetical protein